MRIKLAIIGGGRGAAALIPFIQENKDLEIVGVADLNPEAAGVRLARSLGIPVMNDYRKLFEHKNLNLVMNLTGLSEITEELRSGLSGVEVIGGKSARIFWELIEKQKRQKIEINKNLSEHQAIYRIGLMLSSASKLSEVFDMVVNSATELTDSPAGSLAIFKPERNEMQMVAATGLSENFLSVDHWEVREHGLTRRIIDSINPVVISDVNKIKDIDNPLMLKEGIKSLMAVALIAGDQIVGILYVDDFVTRKYTEREVSVLKTFAVKAALAIEKIKLLEKLEQANMELQEASRLKSDFIANVSHELRTPLNSIIGFSELLIDQIPGEVNEAQLQCLDDILGSGKHLLHLINEILDISKIEAGRFELDLGYFSFQDLMDEIIRVISPLLDKQKLKLKVWLDKKVKEVYADKVKLKQIILNLISNAIKFTAEGGEIGVKAESENGGLVFSVKDTGTGIKESDFEFIFDDFRQVDQSSTRKYEGSGLGLALTKRMVEMHQGRIWVESKLGEGSRFSFFIPGKAKILSKRVDFFSGLKPAAASGEKILIIEDDSKAANILHYYLNNQGYKVLIARDGREGIRLAREMSPVLIVLDIMLPGKDGWEVISELKKNEKTVDIPVIITSIIENKDLAYSFGVLDYFVKPIDKKLLLEKIANICKVRKLMSRHILVISENKKEIREISSLLIAKEFEILKAFNSQDGFQLAKRLKPSLIMLDLSHSIRAGLSLIDELRKDPATREIPIIALTTDELDEDTHNHVQDLMISLINRTWVTEEDLFKEVKKHF